MGEAVAQLSIRLSTVAAAGIGHDGKGFIHFTDGTTLNVFNPCAARVAASLASGAEFITLCARDNPSGGRTLIWDHQLAYPREATND